MYGFRYHLVTVVSLFLALGLGLLLGGSLGQDLLSKQQIQLLSKLEEKYVLVKAENSRLVKKTEELKKQQEKVEEAMAKVSAHYVKGRLQGKNMMIVNLERSNPAPLIQMLQTAGANIQGMVSISHPDVWLPGEKSKGLAQAMEISGNLDGAQILLAAAESLARELCQETEGRWMERMATAGWLERWGTFGGSPDAVILIGGATLETQGRVRGFDIPLIQSLMKKGVNVIGVEREGVSVSSVPIYAQQGISTVDAYDETAGGVAIVDLINGARGHYGIKPSAETLLPDIPQKMEALR